jgi:hypothetical protein
MADRARKISALPTRTQVAANDIVAIVANTSNTPNTYGVRISDLWGNCAANLTVSNTAILTVTNIRILKNSTPANSTITCVQGDTWSDGNFIYVAVANNTLKRATLSTF